MIGDLLFGLILDLIPEKIRKVVGIILIIIGVIVSLIAILYLVAGPADGTGGLGVVIFAMMAILSFAIGLKMIDW